MTCFYSAIYFSTITQWVCNLDLCPAFYADKMVVTSWALQTRLFVQHLAGACIQDTLLSVGVSACSRPLSHVPCVT